MKVVIFIRKKRENDNSFEEIFHLLMQYMGTDVELVELPYGDASFSSIIKNILYARRFRGDVNHISGEVHYIALGTGRNTVITVHDVWTILRGGTLSRYLKKLLFFTLPMKIANRITVISNFTKREVLAVCPWASDKIRVIGNPIALSLTTQPFASKHKNKTSIVLHVGTRPHKNLESVMKAIHNLDVRLVVIGRMTQEQIDIAESYGLNLTNYYNLEYQEVLNWYRKADIVTFPSFKEGFGMPLLEANLMGTPIIASDIDVLHEVAGDAAYYIDPNSAEDIRAGIIKLLGDKELYVKLIGNGYKNIRRFAPDYIAGQYKTVYNEITNS